jgi:hypothetical protein
MYVCNEGRQTGKDAEQQATLIRAAVDDERDAAKKAIDDGVQTMASGT